MADLGLMTLLLVHALATGVMCGLIWTMQVVHYPLLSVVPAAAFPAYEAQHIRRITWIVGPAMGLEAASGVALALALPSGPAGGLAWVGVGLLLVVWISTLTTQGPIHRRLAVEGYDRVAIGRLVATNWVRTVAWSIRAVVAVTLLLVWGGGLDLA